MMQNTEITTLSPPSERPTSAMGAVKPSDITTRVFRTTVAVFPSPDNPDVRAIGVASNSELVAYADLQMAQHLAQKVWRLGTHGSEPLTNCEAAVLNKALDEFIKSRFAFVAGCAALTEK